MLSIAIIILYSTGPLV